MIAVQVNGNTYDLPVQNDQLQGRLDEMYDNGRLSELVNPYTYLNALRPYWPTPMDTAWPKPRLGSLYWPVVGLAHYAFGCFVVDEYTLGQIRADMTSGGSNSITVLLSDDPDDEDEVPRSIPMHFLATRPLNRTGEDPLTDTDDENVPMDAWVMLVVDDRYAKLFESVSPGSPPTQYTAWSSIINAAGVAVFDAIDADYLTPSTRWSTDHMAGRSLSWLADVASLNVGSRIVSAPGSTPRLMRTSAFNAGFLANAHTAAVNDDRFVGGGPVVDDDVDPGMPYGLRVVFKDNAATLPVVVDVMTGDTYFDSSALFIHWADAAGTISSGLRSALAAQFESDWLPGQHGFYDTLYAGFVAAIDNPFLWAVEWYHTANKGFTRFVRPPHHYGLLQAGSVFNSTISGTGTDNHAVRWDGTTAIQDSLVVISDTGDVSTPASVSATVSVNTTTVNATTVNFGSSTGVAGNGVTLTGTNFVTTGNTGAGTITTTVGNTGLTSVALPAQSLLNDPRGFMTTVDESSLHSGFMPSIVAGANFITSLEPYRPSIVITAPQTVGSPGGTAQFGTLAFYNNDERAGYTNGFGVWELGGNVKALFGGFATSAGVGITGTLAPGMTVDGGIIISTGSGSFVSTSSHNTFTTGQTIQAAVGTTDVGLTVQAGHDSTGGSLIQQWLDHSGNLILGLGIGSASFTSASNAFAFAGTVSATLFSGPLTGAVTGNASTATALQTARTINGTSFDGTANITITAAAGTLTGGTLAAGVTASSLTSFGASPAFTGVPTAPTAAPGTNTTQVATTAFVTTAVSGITAGLNFQGTTNCSTNPNYPAAAKGDMYLVSVAGKIGGASGTSVDVGDWYVATAANAGGTEAAVGASWGHMEHNLVGALLASNNLSDLASASTARTNLGVPAGSGTSTGVNTGDQTITLTGNVTGSGTGSFATTIAPGVVTLNMMATMASASLIYRKSGGSGAPEVQTLATLKTDLGLTGTNSGDQTITLTGDVTGSGTGSFATTIAANAVTTTKITDAAVTLAKIANAGANSKLIGSGSAGSGAPYVELTLAGSFSMGASTLTLPSPATQAQQETGVVGTPDAYVTPAVQQFHPSAAKAFVYFTVSGTTVTVQRSYNVTSVTRNGVGDYTVNFTNTLSDALYTVSTMLCLSTGGSICLLFDQTTRATGSFRFNAANTAGSVVDPARVSLTFFGDL